MLHRKNCGAGFFAALGVCSLLGVSGCLPSPELSHYSREVEIAPGKWLMVERETLANKPVGDVAAVDEHTTRFEWQGKEVEWWGREGQVTLREHEGNLYMITLNRQGGSENFHFVFYRLDSSGSRFEKIRHDEFPRKIATQNMWLLAATRFTNPGGERVDTWEMLRTLDVESKGMRGSWTAKLWYHIETGTKLADFGFVDREFLREYKRKYEPIPLPTLVKE